MLALVLSLFVGGSVYGYAPLYGYNVMAQTNADVTASGYRATIQVRPRSDTAIFVWAGGYLSDGTFVQNGILQPGPGTKGQAFVWYDTKNSVPLYLDLPSSGWYTFSAEQSGDTWTFAVTDESGHKRVQQVVHNKSTLQVFQVDAEPWMSAWGPFPTQAMRGVKTRTGATWSVPHLVFSPGSPTCGTSRIRATPGLNLVFSSTTGNSPCYVVLS